MVTVARAEGSSGHVGSLVTMPTRRLYCAVSGLRFSGLMSTFSSTLASSTAHRPLVPPSISLPSVPLSSDLDCRPSIKTATPTAKEVLEAMPRPSSTQSGRWAWPHFWVVSSGSRAPTLTTVRASYLSWSISSWSRPMRQWAICSSSSSASDASPCFSSALSMMAAQPRSACGEERFFVADMNVRACGKGRGLGLISSCVGGPRFSRHE